MASKFRPRNFGNEPMFDPLHVALYYAHKQAERERAAAEAQRVEDEAARRVAQGSLKNSKLLISKLLDVKL